MSSNTQRGTAAAAEDQTYVVGVRRLHPPFVVEVAEVWFGHLLLYVSPGPLLEERSDTSGIYCVELLVQDPSSLV